MKTYNEQYNEIVNNIIEQGKKDNEEEKYFGDKAKVRTVYKDGTPAHTVSLLNQRIVIDNSGDKIPLLYTKKQAIKDPLVELKWIMYDQSNDVEELQQQGCAVWDEWERKGGNSVQQDFEPMTEQTHFIKVSNLLGVPVRGKEIKSGYRIGDGTIGKAYGYQIGMKLRKVPVDAVSIEMVRNKEVRNYYPYLELKEEELIGLLESGQLDELYFNQIEYVIYTLRVNPLSRRIKTSLYSVEDNDHMALEPCVYDTHYQVQGGQLHLTVNIRSNDMALGNPYNVYQYAVHHKLMSKVVGIPTGTLVFNIDNAHVYDRHINLLKEQVNSKHEEGNAVITIEDFGKNIYDFTPDMVKVEGYNVNHRYKYEIAI